MGRAQKKKERYAGIFADRFDELLKDKCKKEKLTNGKIAKDLGVAPASLTHWCSGEKFPSGDMLVKIALYFGVSIDWLVGFIESKSIKQDMKNACSVTGLSSKTILAIQDFIKNNNSTNGCVFFERLFCNRYFLQLLRDLGDVFDAHLLDKLRESASYMLETDRFSEEESIEQEAMWTVDKLAFEGCFQNSAGIRRQKAIEFALRYFRDSEYRKEMGVYKKIAPIDLAKSAATESLFRLIDNVDSDLTVHREIDRMRRKILAEEKRETKT